MKLIRSFSLYTFFTILERALPYLLLPVLTHYFTPHDYGIISNLEILISILLALILLGTDLAINVEYFKLPTETYKKYFNAGIQHTFLWCLAVLLIFILIKPLLVDYLQISNAWYFLIPAIAFFRAFFKKALVYFQVRKRVIQYGMFSLMFSIISISVVLVLVIVYDFNFYGQLYAYLASAVIMFVVSLIYFWRRGLLSFNFSGQFVKEIFRFGLPLIPNRIGHLVINSSDRFFIGAMVGMSSLGVYHVGYAFGSLMFLLSTVYHKAWTPYLFEFLSEGDDRSYTEIVKVSVLYVSFMFLTATLLTFSAPFIFELIFDDRYTESTIYVGWTAFSYAFFSIFQIFAQILFYFKKSSVFFYIGFMNIVLNLVLNYFMVGAYGAIGACYATLITFIVLAMMIGFVSHNFHPLPWKSGLQKMIREDNLFNISVSKSKKRK